MATTAAPAGGILEGGPDPMASAKAARLRYVTDAGPGIRRKRTGKHFRYIGVDGEPIRDDKVLERINKLAIPPAYTDVWISPYPNGHLQATGRDVKGRKQYRYHPRWRKVRDETKYERMVLFGETLPMIRKWVREDLARRGLPREKVLAVVVALLDESHIRVGNQEYARDNASFGLTTMQSDFVDVTGATIHFSFRGKSGKQHSVPVRDRRLARIVRQCQELPGHELFQYQDEQGELRSVESSDVNEYLRAITGQEFTAKDFRTWAGTVMAAHTLKEMGPAESETAAKRNVVEAIKIVAEELGNTPAVARKSYVFPGVIDAYMAGQLTPPPDLHQEREKAESREGLRPEEAEVLALLRGLMGGE